MHRLFSTIILIISLLVIQNILFAQETIILQDALQGSTSAGTQYGGSFTSDGYRPGNGTNHILYDVPVQIPNGYVEFQVKGFNFSDFPPVTVDAQSHESAFIALYDGRGIPEPIVYHLDYRNNYFRWEIIYRSDRYGYPGAGNRFKGKIHCAADTPARLNSTYAVYPYVEENTADWGIEPNGNYTYWDPNVWYTIKVEWNNVTKDFRAYRDGVVVWDAKVEYGVPITDNGVYPVTSPYPWLPIDFKFWLGSGPGRYDNEVPGTTYRNLKVVSLGAIQDIAPTITSSANTSATVDQLYSYDVNATGNPTPTYSLTTAPSGMTINSNNGLIQWTPTSTGSFNVTVKAANGVSPDATQSFTINVNPNTTFAPFFTSTPITSGTVGVLYSYNAETESNPDVTYSLTTSPSGMIINPTSGIIQWTPSTSGNFNVTIKAANGISPDATQSFTINVQSGTTFAPVITSTPVLSGTIGVLYTYDVESDANPNVVYSLTTAPSGMTINPSSGIIQWTPSADGAYDVTVKAANGISPDATQSFTIIVGAPTAPVFTSTPVTTASVGYLYTYDAETDAIPDVTYSLTTAPSGMAINTNSGVIQWTPSAVGDYDVTIKATNGVNPDATQSFTITVAPSTAFAPIITSTPITSGKVGDLYTYDVDTDADPNPVYSLMTAPSGMTIHPSSGIIQWTPTSMGSYNVTVKAANGVSPDATQSFTIDVIPSSNIAPTIVSTPVTTGTVGLLYTYDVETDAYPNPTYSLTASPSGMTINASTGVIQWTPSAGGVFDVTVKASNGVEPDATQSFQITIPEPLPCPVGMISYWKLDETSGSTYSDYFGGNSASSSNVPTPGTGRVDGGQVFNGTSNGLTAPRISAYDFPVGSSFTFEAWVKRAAGTYTTEEVVVERKMPVISGVLTINLKFNYTKQISFSVRSQSASESAITVTGTKVLWDGVWHHVVGVKDGTTNQLKVYVDGVLENTVPATFTYGFTSPSAGISIGWRSVSSEGYFKGSIDEVSIYNVALGGSEITKHYNNGLINLGYCETAAAPIITSTPSTGVDLGLQYSYDVEATGTPAPKFSLTVAPAGMTIDSLSGLIQWTPSSVGDFDVTVTAANGVNPNATQSFTISVEQPVLAPTELSAVVNPADTSNVLLSWKDNSSNETGFVIERKDGDSLSANSYAVLATVAADQISYEDTSVADTTTYTYRVWAYNSTDTSGYSNQAEITTPVPVELTSFFASVIDDQVVLEWVTASETNNIGFNVQRSKDNGKFSDIGFIKGKGTTTSKSVYSFTDKSVLTGKYTYRLKQVDLNGAVTYSYQVNVEISKVDDFVLEQNYPNPFNPSTSIRFTIPKDALVSIKLHNSIGQEMSTILDQSMRAGSYETIFNASALSSGVYFYELIAASEDGTIYKATKRMILMK